MDFFQEKLALIDVDECCSPQDKYKSEKAPIYIYMS